MYYIEKDHEMKPGELIFATFFLAILMIGLSVAEVLCFERVLENHNTHRIEVKFDGRYK